MKGGKGVVKDKRYKAQGCRVNGWEPGRLGSFKDRSLEDEKIRRYEGEFRKRHIKAKGIAQGAE
jgi:hypothetical protein